MGLEVREGVNDRRNPKKMWTLTACRTFSQELVSFLVAAKHFSKDTSVAAVRKESSSRSLFPGALMFLIPFLAPGKRTIISCFLLLLLIFIVAADGRMVRKETRTDP